MVLEQPMQSQIVDGWEDFKGFECVTRWTYIKDILPCDYGQLHVSYINASTDIQQLMCNNTPFSIHSVTYLLCRLRPIRHINMSFTT